ncbi:MAG: hypothetical protein QNJ11_08400 [Woeseiaceae bacterium]|nr:hypothetical protein [Woeseiaceae bacterium]
MDRDSVADVLNRSCHCISVDRDALKVSLEQRFGETGVWARLQESHPHLFADTPVFVSPDQISEMRAIIDAVERVVAARAYRERVLAWVPGIARHDQGTNGVFFGYDFHLTNSGPRLIEINTNAGGAMLLLHIAGAQQACCDAVENVIVGRTDFAGVERTFVEMFRREFHAVAPGRTLKRIAIVDENPDDQFLGPEFTLFQQLFARHEIDAVVAAPEHLAMEGGVLRIDNRRVDLVYSRLTDFYLQSDACRALRKAYRRNAVAVTPGPFGHALYANKRNLTLLSDRDWLLDLGVDENTVAILESGIPTTWRVTRESADTLWAQRKELFFKPCWGFGSRGAYKGAKLTRKTWERILDADYVAQKLVPPSERLVVAHGDERSLKTDVRCYTFGGEIQLLGARLYRGQTTNLRTEGGGLAAVFTTPSF